MPLPGTETKRIAKERDAAASKVKAKCKACMKFKAEGKKLDVVEPEPQATTYLQTTTTTQESVQAKRSRWAYVDDDKAGMQVAEAHQRVRYSTLWRDFIPLVSSHEKVESYSD